MDILPGFLNENQKKLITKLSHKFCNERKIVWLKPLERFGYSGSKLYLIFFGGKENGRPYVIKINDKDKIKREVSASRTVRHYFENASDLPNSNIYNGKLGTFMYPHMGGNKLKDIEMSKTLDEVLFDVEYDIQDVLKIINNCYDINFELARDAYSEKEFDLFDEYDRYLRQEKESDDVVSSILGNRIGSKELKIKFLNTVITDPLLLIHDERFRRLKMFDTIGPVHGDLHASNVVLTAMKFEPKLIDFAWAQPTSSIFKDFVLFECSVRFMLFPKLLGPKIQANLDKALLKSDYNKAKEVINSISNKNTYELLIRLIEIVKCLRDIAAKSSKNFNLNNYLTCQFMVLYGLLKYPTYNTYASLAYLGLLGTYINKNVIE